MEVIWNSSRFKSEATYLYRFLRKWTFSKRAAISSTLTQSAALRTAAIHPLVRLYSCNLNSSSNLFQHIFVRHLHISPHSNTHSLLLFSPFFKHSHSHLLYLFFFF